MNRSGWSSSVSSGMIKQPVATSAWSPLGEPLFRTLWIAAVVSNVGIWMQEIAAAWLMTSLTSAPLMVALVQTATSLPIVLLALPAGALADIVDRRRLVGRLVFTYHDDNAERVALAGDFNRWNPEASLFARDVHGVWRADIEPPPPGRYRYKLLIDGVRWVDDPGNSLKEDDHYGGLNAVLNLA